MPAVRLLVRLVVELLLIVFELALVPVRLVAMLVGSVLLMVGLLGLPAWLVQLVISITGGSQGTGPMPAWELCLLLAVAVPAGVTLMELANLGLSSASNGDALPNEAALDAEPPRALATENAAGGWNVTEQSAPVALRLRAMSPTHVRFAEHEPSVQAASCSRPAGPSKPSSHRTPAHRPRLRHRRAQRHLGEGELRAPLGSQASITLTYRFK